MGTIIKLLSITIVGLLLFSCNPCKRLEKKCPREPQTIKETIIKTVSKDTIIYRDSIIYVSLPQEQIYLTDTVKIYKNKAFMDTVYLEGDYCYSKAWIKRSKFNMETGLLNDSLSYYIKNYSILEKKYLKISEQKTEKETIITNVLPVYFWWLLIAFIVLLLWTFRKLISKIIRL